MVFNRNDGMWSRIGLKLGECFRISFACNYHRVNMYSEHVHVH